MWNADSALVLFDNPHQGGRVRAQVEPRADNANVAKTKIPHRAVGSNRLQYCCNNYYNSSVPACQLVLALYNYARIE